MPANKRVRLNYYRSGRPANRSPFKRRTPSRKRRLFSKIVDFLILAAIVLAIAFSLIVRADPEVVLNSSAYHPASTYYEAARPEFKSLKNRNKLTFDEKGIINSLKQRFPEITSGEVNLPLLGQTPKLKLNIAPPSFLLNSQEADFIVNSKGVAVSKKKVLPMIKELPVIIDQTGFMVRVGQQVLAASEVDFIKNLINQSRRAKVPLSSLILPPRAMELDVRTRDRGYFIKFHLGGDAAIQIGQFLAARQEFDRSNKQPKQYLDVRVPGKIYYK